MASEALECFAEFPRLTKWPESTEPKIEIVDSASLEYAQVIKALEPFGDAQVARVERVCSAPMFAQYKSRCSSGHRRTIAFHGTSRTAAEAIVRNGFDARLSRYRNSKFVWFGKDVITSWSYSKQRTPDSDGKNGNRTKYTMMVVELCVNGSVDQNSFCYWTRDGLVAYPAYIVTMTDFASAPFAACSCVIL
jgi:hypothetical protein